jgi:adenosine deaminase
MHDVWISGNMEKAYKYCEFTKAEMVRLARNAVDMSWAEESVKVQLHTELDAVVCS